VFGEVSEAKEKNSKKRETETGGIKTQQEGGISVKEVEWLDA